MTGSQNEGKTLVIYTANQHMKIVESGVKSKNESKVKMQLWVTPVPMRQRER